jgi:ABC-type dipeptide/oligopeptide/nickel transport system permease component
VVLFSCAIVLFALSAFFVFKFFPAFDRWESQGVPAGSARELAAALKVVLYWLLPGFGLLFAALGIWVLEARSKAIRWLRSHAPDGSELDTGLAAGLHLPNRQSVEPTATRRGLEE